MVLLPGCLIMEVNAASPAGHLGAGPAVQHTYHSRGSYIIILLSEHLLYKPWICYMDSKKCGGRGHRIDNCYNIEMLH